MFDDIWPTWCEYLRPCTCCTWETWEKQASHSQLCSICKRGSKGFDWDIRLSDYQANNGPIYPPWYFSGSLKIKVMMVHQPKRRLFARTVIYVSKYELLTHPFIASVILQISHISHGALCCCPTEIRFQWTTSRIMKTSLITLLPPSQRERLPAAKQAGAFGRRATVLRWHWSS